MVGTGFLLPNATSLALDPVPGIAGTASSLVTALQNLSGSLGSFVAAIIYDGTVARVVVILGLAGIACGLLDTPTALLAGLASIGLFASIYHPVGIAWLVRNARSRGRALGINVVHLQPVQEFLHYPDDVWQEAFADDAYMQEMGIAEEWPRRKVSTRIGRIRRFCRK